MLFINADKAPRALANVEDEVRLDHAKELLGERYFSRSPVVFTQGYAQVNEFILQETKRSLPEKYQDQAFSIAQAIISQANTHELDPLFVVALIKQESHFNPDAVGTVGELGLMQIRPETGQWIAQKFGMKWKGKSTLTSPTGNIKIGVQYISYLREMFGHGRLYLSAYNMGPKKLRHSLLRKTWPKIYSSGVMKRYLDLNKELATKATLEKVPSSGMIALQD